MLKEFFHDILELQPSFRSFIGDDRANGEYENTASSEYKDKYTKLIMKYKQLLDKNKECIDLNTLTLHWIIQNDLDMLKYKDEWMFITSHDNPILNFIIDDSYIYPLKTARDVSNLISRTRKRIPFIKDVMKAMQEGTKEDLTIPKMVCKNVIKQLKKLLEKQSYYVTIPKHLDREEYVRVVDMEYVPVLHELLEFLKNYVHSCRNSIGLCYVKDGKQMYRDIVKGSTTLDMTPEEIFKFGKSELKKLYKELGALKPSLLHVLGYKNTSMPNKELFKKIKSKESEFFESSREIIKAYEEAQEKIRRQILPKYFRYKVSKYNIKKVPTLIEDSSTSAYYYPPAIKSNRRGTVFINTSAIKANPKYTVEALSLHEGVPGHHYQYQFMKQHRFPLYRIYGGDNDAYTEGWALYCEGFIDTTNPKSQFGRWVYSMLRTVRLIIDTGIHYYGWSYKRTLQFMMRHIPLSTEELKVELERYICDPGQAVSYKIGEQFFLTERDIYLANNLGTIKDFHNEVLECGPLPLDVLKYKLRHRLVCV